MSRIGPRSFDRYVYLRRRHRRKIRFDLDRVKSVIYCGDISPAQVRQLKAAGCEKVFREKITHTMADRPQLAKLVKALAPGDVVITPAVDRLSREMQRAGAGIRLLAEPFLVFSCLNFCLGIMC
jgi:Resolvase, N terminal domain